MHEIEFMRYFFTPPFRNLNNQKMIPFPSSLVALRPLTESGDPDSSGRPTLGTPHFLELHFFPIPEIRFLLLPMTYLSAPKKVAFHNAKTQFRHQIGQMCVLNIKGLDLLMVANAPMIINKQ